jgi:aspartyl-tRNA(Asn)/glutamyl-tRNA(Gln) amidotransferase subunit C
MISKEEIQNLAELARLELTESEVESLGKDISDILEYVGQVSEATKDKTLTPGLSKVSPLVKNVLREDTPRGETDLLANKREMLLKALPEREGDYAVVRKIIQKDE